MMVSLFSSFDPTTISMQMNWMSMTMVMIMLPKTFWFKSSRWIKTESILQKKISNELNNITHHKEMIIVSMSIFTMIMINNLMGLFPYIFTSTSHLSVSMSMAIPMWIMLMMYGWTNHTNSMFMHLLPTGTPYVIMPMMILIETTGNLIRPISLSVRLTANMIAGHLLMTLLGSMNETSPMMLLLPMKMTLMMFESAISIIQAYVYTTLITLYSSEIP
uniref:ATP synthase subunit a n=1 Tax=Achilidae gen. 1 sp. n. 1 SX-2018 TaxID=2232070 RepID=A0A3S5XHP5_9HEMI|nr:ATP synthase F0 subunit 6 [Achilidae gen. 1 sp. n. 1 SX-2018]